MNIILFTSFVSYEVDFKLCALALFIFVLIAILDHADINAELAVTKFSIKYCDNPAPDNPKYTCAQLGYHRKELKELQADNTKHKM